MNERVSSVTVHNNREQILLKTQTGRSDTGGNIINGVYSND